MPTSYHNYGSSPYNFQSPAYAVSQEMQDMLKEQRDQERQALLDALKAEEVKANMDYRKEDLASRRADREALAEERAQRTKLLQEQEWDKRLSGIDPSQPLPDALYQEMLKRSPEKVVDRLAPQGSVSTNVLGGNLPNVPGTDMQGQSVDMMGTPGLTSGQDIPTPPALAAPPNMQHFYTGSPQYQQSQRTMQQYEQLINDPNFAHLTPEQKVLRIFKANPEKTDASVIERLLTAKTENPQEEAIVDATRFKTGKPIWYNGQWVDKVPAGVKLTHANTPNPPNPPAPVILEGRDDQGNKVYVDARNPNHPVPINLPSNVKDFFRIGAEPRPGAAARTDPNAVYDPRAFTALQTAQKSKNGQAIVGAMENFINSIRTKDPAVYADVQTIMHDKDLMAVPVDKLTAINPKTGKSVLEGTPEHVEKVAMALRAARGF